MRALLDTNVLSEIARPAPDANVLKFLSGGIPAYISVLTLHELRHGAELVKDSEKRHKLTEWVSSIREPYDQSILPVTADTAETAAKLRAAASRKGCVLHIEDAIIAATAIEHNLTLITRNTSDFAVTQVGQINPWEH